MIHRILSVSILFVATFSIALAQATPDEPLANLKMTAQRTDVEPFEYIDVGPKIPNYVRSNKWGTQVPPRNMMQKPLSPAESIKHFVTPEGFHVELFASEPDIGGKPICMNWDHRGRLWVAETYDYPNERQPEGKGRDRIRICEDTDRDGKADKFTVFAENLSIPTSMAFSHDGVIVHQAPDTLFLQDTDGDDVADLREVLFTGWKTNDTHAGPSNLNYGLDDWFYGMVGYAGFDGIIAGKNRSFRTGFYRFKVGRVDEQVAVTDFEFLRNTNNNSWGIGISEEGLLFGSTANRNPSEFMPIANRHYERVRGWTSSVLTGIADTHKFQPITDNIRQVDHHGGYTAAAGHALYTARRYPPAYWNRAAFVTGPTGHLVGTFALTPNGSGFTSTSPSNLIASDDEWSAPIMAEVGPDGNVWVIDWYNYIVQHNPTPAGFKNGPGNAYLSDLRDKKHGRIYRVVYGANVEGEPESLDGASTKQLVAALTSTNMFWRRHAQRLLIERKDPNAILGLFDLHQTPKVDSIGLDVGSIHALRSRHAMSGFDSTSWRKVVSDSLSHPSSAVIRTAIEMTPMINFGADTLLNSDVFESPDAQVRMAALLAIAEMPPAQELAVKAFDALASEQNQDDRWMLDAATSAAATNAPWFLLAAVEAKSVSPPVVEATSIIAEHVARSRDKFAVQLIIGQLVDSPPEIRQAVLDGFATGWPKGQTIELPNLSQDDLDHALVELFESLPPSSKGQLIRLARSWGSEQLDAKAKAIAESFVNVIKDEKASSDERIGAAVQLIELLPEDIAAAENVLESITPRTAKPASVGMIGSLAASRAEHLGEVMIGAIDRLTPAGRTALLQVMLARHETTNDLLSAIERGTISDKDLSLVQQQALLRHPTKKIRSRARDVLGKTGGLPDRDRQTVLESLLSATQAKGDVNRGKAIYVKNCANCHTHNGEGKKVGPDLSGMAVHPKIELLTHIVDPSRSVEGNYRSYSALTIEGTVINGMLAAETETAFEIIDAKGEHQVVLREDVERVIASRKSLMPDGFEKQIDQQGFSDLLEFLTARGKYLPLPLRSAATAVSTKSLFHESENGPDRIVFADWSPKMVGEVPFQLVDPNRDRTPNIVLLNGPNGTLPPTMPKSVRIVCNSPAGKIHLLSGISGWGYPAHEPKSVSMTVRLHLAGGTSEDHPLVNGVHFADYFRRVDVPGSEFAMMVGGLQLRHVVVQPKTNSSIIEIELVKGNDPTAPIVVAVTIEAE